MEMFEPCDRCVVRRGRTFQKEHEVDVPLTGGLDVPGRVKTVHGCVKHHLQHLPGRRCVFPYPVIGPVKIAQFHFLHELAQQAHLVIRWDDGFQIQRKYQLISALGKGIILTVFLFHRSYNYTIGAGSFGTWFLCFMAITRAFRSNLLKTKGWSDVIKGYARRSGYVKGAAA